MGFLADAMDNLAHDLASSAAARLQGVEQIRVETSELLTDARNLVSRLHMENRDTLSEFRNTLEKDVKNALGNFHKEHQHRAKELRNSLNEFRSTLEEEVSHLLNEFRNTTLAENAADCREAHKIWMSRPTARGELGRPARTAAEQPKPAKARKEKKKR